LARRSGALLLVGDAAQIRAFCAACHRVNWQPKCLAERRGRSVALRR